MPSTSLPHVGLRVFMEPGAGLIREAGFIVSSVVDFLTAAVGPSPSLTRASTTCPRSSSTILSLT